jgi:tRNA(fMet)-specific endonuclease VapC
VSFLIDTDTCSAHLRQKSPVTSRFLQYTGQLHVSVITVGELYTWALRAKAPPQRMQSLLEMLTDVTVLDVTGVVAAEFGRMRAELMDIGRPAPDMDLLIAATAVAHNLTVVTHNTVDFAGIPGVRTIDWLAPY